MLKEHADLTQSKLVSSLGKLSSFKSIKTRQLWITNQLIIKNTSQETIQILADSDEVSKVEADRIILLLDPLVNKLYGKACNKTTHDAMAFHGENQELRHQRPGRKDFGVRASSYQM